MRKIQEEKLISIGAMSSAMPHEINNPLTILSGSVNLLKKQLRNKENMDFEKIDKLLGNLDNGVVRISKIITSVKSLSSDSEKLELENFTIFELLEDILILNQSAIISNKINFSFDDSNKVEVTGIRIQIEQILINYIHNSIDEIMAKENKWISIQCETGLGLIKVRCIDSGLGISEEIQHKIFDPFYTSKEVGKGTGLGLSLSKKMARRHGGDIYYELYGGNTSFVLELPSGISKLDDIQV